MINVNLDSEKCTSSIEFEGTAEQIINEVIFAVDDVCNMIADTNEEALIDEKIEESILLKKEIITGLITFLGDTYSEWKESTPEEEDQKQDDSENKVIKMPDLLN